MTSLIWWVPFRTKSQDNFQGSSAPIGFKASPPTCTWQRWQQRQRPAGPRRSDCAELQRRRRHQLPLSSLGHAESANRVRPLPRQLPPTWSARSNTRIGFMGPITRRGQPLPVSAKRWQSDRHNSRITLVSRQRLTGATPTAQQRGSARGSPSCPTIVSSALWSHSCTATRSTIVFDT